MLINNFTKEIQNYLLISGLASLLLYVFSLFLYFASTATYIGVAFDLSIIFLALGFYRFGKMLKSNFPSWKFVSISLTSASILDLFNIVLYLIYNEKAVWISVGFQIYRLITGLIYYILIILGFLMLFKLQKKIYSDDLSRVPPRLFLVCGYGLTSIGYVFLWTNEFLISDLVSRPDWLIDVASYILFVSNFIVILGFLNLIYFFQSIGKKKEEDIDEREEYEGEE
ncbi:MAG: hypothetical protein ACTSPP_02585 [Candidatus Heimdallarchaeaceae archaeon]